MKGRIKIKKKKDVEEEELIDEFNVHHDDDGRFSSTDDSKCDSSYFVDKDRKRKGGSIAGREDMAGRGRKRTGQGPIRCKGPASTEKKWESLYREFVEGDDVDTPHDESVDVPQDMYDCAKMRQRDKVLMRKLKAAVSDAKEAGKKECGLSIDDAVRIINTLALSEKGKAYEKSEVDG